MLVTCIETYGFTDACLPNSNGIHLAASIPLCILAQANFEVQQFLLGDKKDR